MAARRREAPSLPACCTHDLVQRAPAEGEAPDELDVGLVWRVAGEEDSEEEYDVSSDEDAPEDRPEQLPDGHAQVAWLMPPPKAGSQRPPEEPLADETDGPRPDRMDTRATEGLTVVDRCFNVGDVVASAADPTGQTAVVLRVDRRCDVLLSEGEGRRLQRQPAAHLQPVVPHYPGQPVLCLGWLGKVEEVYETVSVRLDAGGSVQCSGHEGELPLAFPEDARQMLFVEAGGCRFFPGQRVVVEPAQTGGWGGRRRTLGPERPGTVTGVRASELLVDWVANVGGLLADRPGDHVSPSDCLLLRTEHWQASACHLGVRAFWRGPEPAAAASGAAAPPGAAAGAGGEPAAGEPAGEASAMDVDAAASGSASEAEEGGSPRPERPAGGWGSYAKRLISTGLSQGGQQKRARRGNKRKKQQKRARVTAQVLRTHTAVDVVWQDGTPAAGLPAVGLLPRVHLDEHDFWPDDVVSLERDSLSGEAAADAPDARVGVVRRCNARERTAEVAWLGTGEHGFLLPAAPDAPTETLPVYRLQAHPAFNYQAGDVVLRVDPAAEAEGGLLGSVGEVLSSRGGMLSLRLASGEAVQLMPDRVVMGSAGDDYDDEPYEGEEDGASDASGSWSTCSDPEEAGAEAALDLGEAAARRLADLESAWSTASEAEAEAEAAAGAATAAAAPAPVAGRGEPCLASEVGKVSLAPPGQQSQQAGEADAPAAAQPDGGAPPDAADAADGAEGSGAASPLAEALGFPHFAVEEECPADHAFASAAGRPSRRFQAAVLAEWRSLGRNLPASIWVRAYETRMDLMRFAVLAAADTPYAGHLFLFDLQLLPDYPAAPPSVLYHSWGLRVNPNLYENGKVCLSLLGTWAGNRHEVWTPESTLLQLVVSIQGLILVPKPYFNEAGFERQTGSVEGEANSVLYNEQAALLTVRSAVHLLRRPPGGFDGFVRGYYKREAAALLAPLQRVVDGGEAAAPAGEAGAGEGQQDAGREGGRQGDAPPPASAGFRLMLRELLPRFRTALDAL